jgi:hypothetical protein
MDNLPGFDNWLFGRAEEHMQKRMRDDLDEEEEEADEEEE